MPYIASTPKPPYYAVIFTSVNAPVDHTEHAALSASAGTGKTHVLTARVLRLLLAGVDPASILCLTFTKAGAAEMAERIHARLAHWVRLRDSELARELKALRQDEGPEMRAIARTLFAEVLEATESRDQEGRSAVGFDIRNVGNLLLRQADVRAWLQPSAQSSESSLVS